MIVDLAGLAKECRNDGVGLGAFNVILLEQGEALVDAAERVGLPVVLQLSQNAVLYHGARLKPLGRALLALAEASSVPVAVHLDHAESVELCKEAVDLGFSGVMYDGSKEPYDRNVAFTRDVVAYAHAKGVSVEAELGEVGGKNGVHDPSTRTDPVEAATFVRETGVDLLAVAVGSSHAMLTRSALLDGDLISSISRVVTVPLVLHGSSGVDDAGMQAAIRAGMTKINVSTHLNKVFTSSVRKTLQADTKMADPRKFIGPAAKGMSAEAERLLRLYALK